MNLSRRVGGRITGQASFAQTNKTLRAATLEDKKIKIKPLRGEILDDKKKR